MKTVFINYDFDHPLKISCRTKKYDRYFFRTRNLQFDFETTEIWKIFTNLWKKIVFFERGLMHQKLFLIQSNQEFLNWEKIRENMEEKSELVETVFVQF